MAHIATKDSLAEEEEAEGPSTGNFSETAISAIIAERIDRGVYAPGSRVPAERVLATELGVSRRFVRMAYSKLIERGMLEKSHYRRPYVSFPGGAPQLSSVRSSPSPARDSSSVTPTIAAILPSHPKFPGGLSIVSGIHKVLSDIGSPYRLTFLDTFHPNRSEVLRREAQAIHSAIEDGVTGLIWWYYSDEAAVLDIIREYPDISLVFIDRHPKSIHCDFAGIDDVESSRIAVEHLLDLNHRRIAHLMDPGNYSTILERAEGYRIAHTSRGISVSEELIEHLNWDEDRMERAFDRFYSLAKPPTALFTSNDFIAYEFLKVAESRGIRVPQDLSIVGHGNIDRYTPREFLTSVDQPFETIGKAAAKLLLKRLESGNTLTRTYQEVILQASLVVRDSCQRLATP